MTFELLIKDNAAANTGMAGEVMAGAAKGGNRQKNLCIPTEYVSIGDEKQKKKIAILQLGWCEVLDFQIYVCDL